MANLYKPIKFYNKCVNKKNYISYKNKKEYQILTYHHNDSKTLKVDSAKTRML